MNIYERIKAEADKQGLSIRALEIKSGISNGTIKRWKTQEPGCNKLNSIANTLNISIEWLITGKEDTELLTQEEKELLLKYRKLDETGRRYLRYAIELAKIQQDS